LAPFLFSFVSLRPLFLFSFLFITPCSITAMSPLFYSLVFSLFSIPSLSFSFFPLFPPFLFILSSSILFPPPSFRLLSVSLSCLFFLFFFLPPLSSLLAFFFASTLSLTASVV
jgi:hypothetical protein